MRPTRRLGAVAALAVLLAVLAVVLSRPFLLAGSAIVGAWLLSRQVLFVRELDRAVDELTVVQSPATTGVRTDDAVPITFTATIDRPAGLRLDVAAGLPTAAVADEALALSIDPDETGDRLTTEVRWPIAGRHRFDAATLSATDGLFRETIPVGSRPTVTVEPRTPRNVHVGEGGDRLATAYGEHEAGRLGSGLDPAELREYVPGDTADRIDWKATARLGTPHVREYEAETDRRTLLVIDHRASLATGPAGETKLEYLRAVALATAESARTLGDPLGLLAVGDGGITERLDPTTAPAGYATVRNRLLDLEPTDARSAIDSSAVRRPDRPGPTPAEARRTVARLEGDDAFARTLRPFYADSDTYRERIETDPLYGAVRSTLTRDRGSVWTVLFTDDAAPTELRETVKLARREGQEVLVLLAPTVLYEPGGLADLERAYDRYAAFEELRRELARTPGVSALEVGPGDRLATVLAAGRDRRVRASGSGGERR